MTAGGAPAGGGPAGAPQAALETAESRTAHLLQQLVELAQQAESRAQEAAAAAAEKAWEERRKALVDAQRERRKASLERVGAYATGVASAISVVSGIIASALLAAALSPPGFLYYTEPEFEASGAACYAVGSDSCQRLQTGFIYLSTLSFVSQMATLHHTIAVALGKTSPAGVSAMLLLFSVSLGISAIAGLASAWLTFPLHVCIVESVLMAYLSLIFLLEPLLSLLFHFKFALLARGTLELGRPFGRVRIPSWLHFAASGYVDPKCPYWQPWVDDSPPKPHLDGISEQQVAAAPPAAGPHTFPGSAADPPLPPGWQRFLAAVWRLLYVPTLIEHRVYDAVVLIQANLVGPDLDKGGPGGLRPLHLAALAGRSNPVSYLLRAGANPNVRFAYRPGCGGITPLHLAAARGDLGIAAELLRYGANAEALDYKKQTPADVAAAMGQRAVLDLLEAYWHTLERSNTLEHEPRGHYGPNFKRQRSGSSEGSSQGRPVAAAAAGTVAGSPQDAHGKQGNPAAEDLADDTNIVVMEVLQLM